jgi:hypothetical protein
VTAIVLSSVLGLDQADAVSMKTGTIPRKDKLSEPESNSKPKPQSKKKNKKRR